MVWTDFFKKNKMTEASLKNAQGVRAFLALENSSPHKTVENIIKDYETLDFNIFDEILNLTEEEAGEQENFNLLTLATILTEISDIFMADKEWSRIALVQFNYGVNSPKATNLNNALFGASTRKETVGVVLDPVGKDNKNEKDILNVGINKPIIEKLSFLLTQETKNKDIAIMLALSEVVSVGHGIFEEMIDSIFKGFGTIFDYSIFMDGKTQLERQSYLLENMLERATAYIDFSMGGPTTEVQLLSLSQQLRQMVAYEWKRHPETTIIAEILSNTKDPVELGYVIDYVIGENREPELVQKYLDVLRSEKGFYTAGQSLGQPKSLVRQLISVYDSNMKEQMIDTWLLGDMYYESVTERSEVKYIAVRAI